MFHRMGIFLCVAPSRGLFFYFFVTPSKEPSKYSMKTIGNNKIVITELSAFFSHVGIITTTPFLDYTGGDYYSDLVASTYSLFNHS